MWNSLARSLGVSYPGENFEPCQICYDRSYRLQHLESRIRYQNMLTEDEECHFIEPDHAS